MEISRYDGLLIHPIVNKPFEIHIYERKPLYMLLDLGNIDRITKFCLYTNFVFINSKLKINI